MERIYFDNAATSFPKAPGVAEAVSAYLEGGAFNVGRGNYEASYDLSERILDLRENLLALFDAPHDARLCFTGGATAAVNQFLFGLLKPGDHIITSSMEHNAVMRPLHVLQKEGVKVTAVTCDAAGRLDPDAVEEAIRPETKAVILTCASNVCGTILPIGEVGRICRRHDVWFAVDAAQAAGVLPLSMKQLCVNFLAFPGHKGLLGPQGLGGFAVEEELAALLRPLTYGGTGSLSDREEQPDFLPDKFESGTLPLPAIMGLRASVDWLLSRPEGEIRRHEQNLTRRFLLGLKECPGVRVLGIDDPDETEDRVAVVSVDFLNMDNAAAAFMLEDACGVMTRVGLHCAPRAHQTLGTFSSGTVRFSFGWGNTEEEVDRVLESIRAI